LAKVNRSPSLPTLVGGANGSSEIVKIWKKHFRGILNSDNSANKSAESVEHSIDSKDNYMGLEMPMCSCFVDITSSKVATEQGTRVFLQSTCSMQMNLFFLSELFNMCIVHGYIPNSVLKQ